MNLVTLVLAMVYPLCGTSGANGIPAPGVVDFAHLHLLGHSEFLMAPADFSPQPGIVAPVFHMSPQALLAAFEDVAALQPRSATLDIEPQALQAAWVLRSPMGNFPDIVEIEVLPEPGGNSSFVFYSHAVYGWSDYGVNRRHAIRWLKDLQMKAAD
jgi:uncharacterized protein (DUF1499 family)